VAVQHRVLVVVTQVRLAVPPAQGRTRKEVSFLSNAEA
jgi:hypothetical protein